MQNPTGIGTGGADFIFRAPETLVVPETSLAIARNISATGTPCVAGPDLTGLVHHPFKALVSIVEPFLSLGTPVAWIDTNLRQVVGNIIAQVLLGW